MNSLVPAPDRSSQGIMDAAETARPEMARDDAIMSEEKALSVADSTASAAPMAPGTAGTFTDGGSAPAPVQRQLIRNANVTWVVDEFDRGSDYLRARISQDGGYIANEEISQWEESQTGYFQIRLPADRLDPFLEALEDMGTVQNRNLYTEDVTMEYVDVQSRIQVMRVKEARLLELIAQSGDLADLLAVENELGATRGELESLEGRMRYLSNQVEYSTVSLQLRQKPVSTSAIQGTGLEQVLERFREAFVVSVNQLLILLGNLVVWIGRALPYLVVLAAVFCLIWRIVRRKRKTEENG
jgi:hypothetical protein